MKDLYIDFLVFIFLFFTICLGVLFYVPGSTPKKSIPFKQVNTTGVSLFFSPNPTILLSDSTASVNLMIDTNGKSVTSVQTELTFDPQSITALTVEKPNQSFFPEGTYDVTLSDVRYINGRISYAVSLKPGIEAKTGRGEIAKISFTRAPYNPTSFTEISFVDQSSALAADSNESILTSTQPLIIQFATPVGSASGSLNPLPGQ